MSITLATTATQFLQRQGLAKSTLRSYEQILLPLLKKYGHWPVELLDSQILSEYLLELTHLSYTTHNHHQTVINALLNFAVNSNYIKTNPIRQLPKRKPERNRDEHNTDQTIHYLTTDQLSLLYKVIKINYRLYTIVKLLHSTGARIDELLAMDLEQIDQKNYKFQVIGKGNLKRWCYYNKEAAIVLEEYLEYYRHQPHSALFTAQQPFSKEITRVSYRTVNKDWKKLTQNHPLLEGVRLHDLRHTFATERVGLIGIEELRALMGHKSITTTLRYQKVTSQKAEIAAQKAFQLLEKIPPKK